MHANRKSLWAVAIVACAVLVLIGVYPGHAEKVIKTTEPAFACPDGGIRISTPTEKLCDELCERAGRKRTESCDFRAYEKLTEFDKRGFLEAQKKQRLTWKKVRPEDRWSQEKSGFCVICYAVGSKLILDPPTVIETIDKKDNGDDGEIVDGDGSKIIDKVNDGGPACDTERCAPRFGRSEPWTCKPKKLGTKNACGGFYSISNYAGTCCSEDVSKRKN